MSEQSEQNAPERCSCCTCGYTWVKGQYGGHSCADQLLARVAELEAERDRFQRSAQVNWNEFSEALKQQSAVDERAAFQEWYATPEAFKAGDSNGWSGIAWAAWQKRASLSAPSHGEQVRDNRAEFKREERYMVVKLSKLADDLGGDELSREEQIYRLAHFGKALVECVVVESDWPEYEPTWAAIKARVTGSIASNQLPGGWAAKPTDDGEGFIISSPRVNGVASHFSVFPDSKDYASCALWKMLAAAPSAGSHKEQK